MNYKLIIGIEVHVELNTKSKMFCDCSADHFRAKPNTQTCPVCLGLPGALPVPNLKAIENCILIGLAFGCKVNKRSFFERKNYFYPDLPKGYQISQYKAPFCINGKVELKDSMININRVHMEEETAKMKHRASSSLIDFNRSGAPLVEIVSEPDIKSSEQAVEFLKKIQQIVRYLGVSDCDMEKGSMRCEANISLSTDGKLPNYRAEIKNINSFRFVKKALEFEIKRQTKALNKGEKLEQETRGFDEDKETTYVQRTKEEAHDYRYFPEPDIPPFQLSNQLINKLSNQLIEMPGTKINRFMKDYKISRYNAEILTRDKKTAEYFEKAVSLSDYYKIIASIIVNKKVDINKTLPKQLIKQLKTKKKSVIRDSSQLAIIVKEVIKKNKKAADDYNKGKKEAIGFLIGQIMQESKGRADAKIVKKLLLEKLPT
jgi:aspartyl-tRNA(Asn)/glutamyl-tRNA(Gln) amidotransferase subunit B